MSRPAALVLVMLLLAGCMGRPTECGVAPVSPRSVAADAPSSGGKGPAEADILVTAAGGDPIANAGVVVYWDTLSIQERQDKVQAAARELAKYNESSNLDPAERSKAVDAQAAYQRSLSPEAIDVLLLRSDATGHAHAFMPADRQVDVAAAAPGWTEEDLAPQGPVHAGVATPVSAPLYHAEVAVTLQAVWKSPVQASTPGGGPHDWQPQQVVFAQDPAVQAGYLARLDGLSANLTWSNGAPQGVADLGIGVGASAGSLGAFADNGPNQGIGPQRETLQVPDWHALGGGTSFTRAADGSLWMGPATSGQVVTPLGMPFTLAVRATFGLHDLVKAQCGQRYADATVVVLSPADGTPLSKAASAPWALLGLLAAALWVRRR